MISRPSSADGAIERDVFVGDLRGARVSRGGTRAGRQRTKPAAHFVERPAQIDRGRARFVKSLPCGVERGVAGVLPYRHRQAIGRRHPDQRSPPHPHIANCESGVLEAAQRDDPELVRQPALVDHVDAVTVLIEPNRTVVATFDVHETASVSRRSTMELISARL